MQAIVIGQNTRKYKADNTEPVRIILTGSARRLCAIDGGPLSLTFPYAEKQPRRKLLQTQIQIENVIHMTPRKEMQSPPQPMSLMKSSPKFRMLRTRCFWIGSFDHCELRVGPRVGEGVDPSMSHIDVNESGCYDEG